MKIFIVLELTSRLNIITPIFIPIGSYLCVTNGIDTLVDLVVTLVSHIGFQTLEKCQKDH